MRRSTYLVAKDKPSTGFHVEDDGSVRIEGLVSARHVQTKLPYTGSGGLGAVSIEFSQGHASILDLPFDPPAKQGLHAVADENSEVGRVLEFFGSWGVGFGQSQPVEVEHWLEWFDARANAAVLNAINEKGQLDVDAEGISAFRISLDASKSEVTVEAWFPETEWHTLESAPTELGILQVTDLPDAYLLNGRVRKLGKDTKSEPVIFKWYAKHRRYENSAHISLAEPYGLHPELVFRINGTSPLPNCRLYAQLDLPTNLFLDQYQLEDLPRLHPPSQLVGLWGETDLEKPEWQVHKPSTSLFLFSETENSTYKIPLHARYERPTERQGVSGEISAPYVFWACQDKEADRKLEFLEPRELIGVDSVFPLEDTTFYVMSTNSVPYEIPAISASSEQFVERITTIVVITGALCVMAAVLNAVMKRRRKLKAE